MNDENESRRASPRVVCRWPVVCVTEQKKTFTTRAVNISQGGAQVMAPVAFKKGERLYLEIKGYLNQQYHIIKVVGVVAYVSMSTSEGVQLGLKFVSHLTIEDSKFIQQYVKSMMSN